MTATHQQLGNGNRTMRAARLHAFEGIDGIRLDTVSRPEPGPGEVLVQVHAAGVNPVDWKIADGMGRHIPGFELPHTLGCDVSGVVVDLGPQVTAFAIGDEVFGYTSLARPGCYAHFVIARPDELALKPASLSHVEAAAIPVAGLTAWEAMFDAAGLSAGQTVLIHAAAGGVGSIAVQLAKARGARVIGTASGSNEALVRSLGADEFINYRETEFDEAVQGVDVVFDTIGGETQSRSFQVLRPNGFLVSVVSPPDPGDTRRAGVRSGFIAVRTNGARLAEIVDLVNSGQVRAEVARKFPLEQVVDALRESQAGRTRGKLIVEP